MKQHGHTPFGVDARNHSREMRLGAWTVLSRLLCATCIIVIILAQAQPAPAQGFIPCAQFGKQPLITIPEIKRDAATNMLRGVVITADEQRNLWFKNGSSFYCAAQYMRYYKGYRQGHPEDWDVSSYNVSGFPEPIPGPTLRARVGDLVEITFLNQINTKDFGNSIDRGEEGKGCDQAVLGAPNWQANTKYNGGNQIKPASNNPGGYFFAATQQNLGTSGATSPDFPQTQGQTVNDGTVTWTNVGTNPPLYPGSDTMPNCIHGSSTSNIHFHGTHTTPSTTGDNVLLQIRPSLRTYPPEPNGDLVVTEGAIKKPFEEFFRWCEKNGSPTEWEQLPLDFRQQQMGPLLGHPRGWLGEYDQTAAYKPLPLWPPNKEVIKKGGWPQFYIGAFPYCFRLPAQLLGGKQYHMYQAPGTHWYHAHKHGSTDINVSNGMTGAFIIEGDYDDALKAFYKSTKEHQNWDLEEVVMVFQQLSTVPNLLSSAPAGPAVISVNGRQRPVVTMRPNQVQMWRLVNGDSQSLVTMCPFDQGIVWRQIAQDGVQFKLKNYDKVGKPNAEINLAAGNRADLLVQAPGEEGTYTLNVATGVAPGTCPATTTLLTVHVDATKPAAQPQMTFIDAEHFPVFPDFLEDIPASEIHVHRDLVFNTVPNPNPNPPPVSGTAPPANSHFINNKQFSDEHVDQVMLLDTAEEWKMLNLTGIWHPFHIHVNPFQITEVFNPNSKIDGKCVDPEKPETWKPCPSDLPAPKDFVWWDVFAIPGSRTATLSCTTKEQCPVAIRDKARCPGGGKSCTVIIPGYFKMRTRFADFTGQYVLHCHILAHEDRGMMELVEVVPNTTIFSHH